MLLAKALTGLGLFVVTALGDAAADDVALHSALFSVPQPSVRNRTANSSASLLQKGADSWSLRGREKHTKSQEAVEWERKHEWKAGSEAFAGTDRYGGGSIKGPLGPYGPYLPPSPWRDDQGKQRIKGPSCPRYVSSTWPKVSFWSQQVAKRLRNLEAKPVSEDVLNFTKQAAWMLCQIDYDPRKGGKFSESNAAYYKQVQNLSADVMKLPPIPHAHGKELNAFGGCMQWAHMLWCDMAVWAEEIRGNKTHDEGDICWDKVELPQDYHGWGLPYAKSGIVSDHSQCDQHGLNKFVLSSICDASFGVHPISSPSFRNLVDVMPASRKAERDTCRTKLPNFVQFHDDKKPLYYHDTKMYSPSSIGLDVMKF